MNTIDFSKLSNEDLNNIKKKCELQLVKNTYFNGIEKNKNINLPKNSNKICKKINIIDHEKDEDEYMFYEEGNAWKATLKIDGLDDPVMIKRKTHFSKYTFTESFSIQIQNEFFIYSHGYYRNTGNREDEYNEGILNIIYNALGLTKKNMPSRVINLIFYNDPLHSLQYEDNDFCIDGYYGDEEEVDGDEEEVDGDEEEVNGDEEEVNGEDVNGIQQNRIEQMRQIQSECLELFRKKNSDYGDAFAKFGIIGILTRIEDKIQRSISISKKNITLVNDESLKDTMLDLHNYAAMSVMLLEDE